MSDIDHEQRRDELAAYLLEALEPGEAAELERYLGGCPECRDELERLRPVVQALPESVERVEPPAQLRARVMSEVRADEAGARAASSDRRRRTSPWRSFLLRPAVGAAVVALIVAGVAAYAISDGDSGDNGATTVVAGTPPGVTARMVRDGDSGILRLANLRRLPSTESLQAWVQRGKRVERAGPLFLPHSDGTATAVIDDMEGVSTVMVTAEPRAGSAFPTSEPLISVSVRQ